MINKPLEIHRILKLVEEYKIFIREALQTGLIEIDDYKDPFELLQSSVEIFIDLEKDFEEDLPKHLSKEEI